MISEYITISWYHNITQLLLLSVTISQKCCIPTNINLKYISLITLIWWKKIIITGSYFENHLTVCHFSRFWTLQSFNFSAVRICCFPLSYVSVNWVLDGWLDKTNNILDSLIILWQFTHQMINWWLWYIDRQWSLSVVAALKLGLLSSSLADCPKWNVADNITLWRVMLTPT